MSEPDLAEFIGGPFASSMSREKRAAIIMRIMPGIPPLTVSSLFSETLDAVIFMRTGIQPATQLKHICDSCHQLSDLCQREYSMRCCEDVGLANQLLNMVTSCSSHRHQVCLVDAAEHCGFRAFDIPRGAERDLATCTLEDEVGRLQLQVEHARLAAITAKCLESAALLAFRAAILELQTAEEEEAIIANAT